MHRQDSEVSGIYISRDTDKVTFDTKLATSWTIM